MVQRELTPLHPFIGLIKSFSFACESDPNRIAAFPQNSSALDRWPQSNSGSNHPVKLNVNARRTVDVSLQAGNVSETVTVTSGVQQVDTQSATASNVISGDQVRELSLNNRNWAQLVLLSPGVSSNLQDQIYVGT